MQRRTTPKHIAGQLDPEKQAGHVSQGVKAGIKAAMSTFILDCLKTLWICVDSIFVVDAVTVVIEAYRSCSHRVEAQVGGGGNSVRLCQ